MSAPTITSLDNAIGPTGGRRILKIVGTNFQLPPGPSAYGITPVANPSVEVLFGTVPAREVRVLTASLLHVITPIHDPGTVALTVRNIDQTGAVVAGETATLAAAYTFARPTIGSATPGEQSNLSRLVRALIEELRRQLLANVVLTTHTDYDDTPDGANVAALADIPGLVLSGPTLRLNRFYSTNEPREADDTHGDTYAQRPPRTVDLAFTLIGVDELMARELDLISECTAFFLRNPLIRMPRDPASPTEYVEYEMEIDDGGDFKSIGTPNNSNVRAFSGGFLIRGLDIEDVDMRAALAAPVADVLPPGADVGDGGGPGGTPTPDAVSLASATSTAGVTTPAGHIAQIQPDEE